jgi:hypothetical protein
VSELQGSAVEIISFLNYFGDVGDVVENKRPSVNVADIEIPIDRRAGLGNGVQVILAGGSGGVDAQADFGCDFCVV